jgi:hypothetical protein
MRSTEIMEVVGDPLPSLQSLWLPETQRQWISRTFPPAFPKPPLASYLNTGSARVLLEYDPVRTVSFPTLA